jgi:hypothetical protein
MKPLRTRRPADDLHGQLAQHIRRYDDQESLDQMDILDRQRRTDRTIRSLMIAA